MNDEMIRKRVGRTPLVRAHRLERELGMERIYMKLEGNNPSGHREDRLAYLTIRDALSRGKRTICMGTYGTVGGSLSYLSRYYDVRCVFYVPSRKKALRRKLLLSDDIEIVEFGRTYEDCVRESRRVSAEKGWYNANPGLANNVMNMYAFSYMAKEIHGQQEEAVDTVCCQTSNGSSISGLHLGFKQLWVDETIEKLPLINAASTAHGNAIAESFLRGSRDILTLEPRDIRESRYNRNLINLQSYNGQDALNAVHDTGGRVIGVTDEELLEYSRRFRSCEDLRFSLPNAYPVVAFMKDVEKGLISEGTHVIVMNDARSNIDIRTIERDDLAIPYDSFLDYLDDWLIDFTDPMDEMREAVDNAFTHGHVLCAFSGDRMVGIAILSRTRFETFFPQYHLSYIATRKDAKGRGIATQLLQRAIEVTGGDLSLHVETDNRRAIRLYEKMGLRKKYYRMLYKGE